MQPAPVTPLIDLQTVWEFLKGINPAATPDDPRWTFYFVGERKGTDYYGAMETLVLPYKDFCTLARHKNEDACGIFLEVTKGKYVRLPGTVNHTQERPFVVHTEDAKIVLANIRAGKNGDPAPVDPSHNVTHIVAPAESSEIEPAHLQQLKARGITAETAENADIYSISSKKTIQEKLRRTQWNNGSVYVFPHYLDSENDPAALRAVADVALNIGGTPSRSVWASVNGTQAVPYLIPQARADGRYESLDVCYWVFDEIDALLLCQEGLAAVGLDHVDAIFDLDHERETGTEKIHPALETHVTLRNREHVVLYYSRLRGKHRHAAHRLVRLLKAAGAGPCRILDVPGGNLAKYAGDGAGLAQLFTKARIPAEADIESPYATINSALGDDCPVTTKPLYIPEGFEIDEHGAVYRRKDTMTANGPVSTMERIMRNAAFPTRLVQDFSTGEVMYEFAFHTGFEWSTKLVPASNLLRKSTVTSLANHGLHCSDHNAASLIAWLHEFCEINARERRFERVHSYRSCGWYPDSNGGERFAHPDDGVSIFDMNNGRQDILRGLRRGGERAKSLSYVKAFVQSSLACKVAVLNCLAATMIPVTGGAANSHVHLWGTTTRGKTLSMRVGASVFGHPTEMMVKGDVTQVGLEQTLGAMSGVGVIVDETTNQQDQSAENMAYLFVEGRGKTRGAKDGGIRQTLAWKTSLTTTGEKPLHDEDAQNGAQARVLNVRFTGVEGIPDEFVHEIYHGIDRHYGHLVHEWAQHWAARTASENMEEHETLMEQLRARANACGGANLRQVNILATLIMTARHANALWDMGIEIEDLERMLEPGENTVLAPSVRTAGQRAIDLIVTHLRAHPSELIAYNDNDSRGTVTARRRADGHLCIDVGRLKQLLAREKLNMRQVRVEWKEQGVLADHDANRDTKVMWRGTSSTRYIVLNGDILEVDDPALCPPRPPQNEPTPPTPPTPPTTPPPGLDGNPDASVTNTRDSAAPDASPAEKRPRRGTKKAA